MNDSHVAAVSINKVLSCEAYVLFYVRKIDPEQESIKTPLSPENSGGSVQDPPGDKRESKSAEVPTNVFLEKDKGNIHGRLKKRPKWILYAPLRYVSLLQSSFIQPILDFGANSKNFRNGDVISIINAMLDLYNLCSQYLNLSLMELQH